jgi:hypothetical protein
LFVFGGRDEEGWGLEGWGLEGYLGHAMVGEDGWAK